MYSGNIYLGIALSLCLSACAMGSKNYQDQLAKAATCCQDKQTIRYQPLAYNQSLKLKLGGKKAYARYFPSGKSYFAAVQLPVFTQPYQLHIVSLAQSNQIAVPSIQLLDEKFQIIKELLADEFTYSNGEFSKELFINKKEEGYKYLLIYIPTNMLGKQLQARLSNVITVTVPLSSGGIIIPQATDKKQKIITSANGLIQIKASLYKPNILK